MTLVEVLPIILGVLAIGVVVIPYSVSRFYYNPRIRIKIGGEQSGTPIPVPSSEGEIRFGIGTGANKEVMIKEILVLASPNDVELSGGPSTISLDHEFPAGIQFSGSWLVAEKTSKVFAIGYKVKDKRPKFQLKLIVLAKIDESMVGFPWDIVPPKVHRKVVLPEFIVEDFRGSIDERLKRYGYALGPGEAMIVGKTIERKT